MILIDHKLYVSTLEILHHFYLWLALWKEHKSKQLGHDHLVIVMQMLILPMLAHAFQNGQSWEVVDPSIIKTIVDKLLDPPEEVYKLKNLHDSVFFLI